MNEPGGSFVATQMDGVALEEEARRNARGVFVCWAWLDPDD